MPQEFFQYLPATSQAPQPRQWFAEIADESILRLLDPLDAGTPDLAPAEIWRRSDEWLHRYRADTEREGLPV